MWELQGQSIGRRLFESLEPIETLYEFESPRIFTVCDVDGQLHLAYWSDDSSVASRYILAPTTSAIVNALREGQISVWTALNQPQTWICDTNLNGDVTDVYSIDFDAIPKDALPTPSAMLLLTMDSESEGTVTP